MDANETILVTGASGFIGGRLLKALLARGARLRVATTNPERLAQLASERVAICKADLADTDSLKRAVEGCGAVYHVAYVFGAAARQRTVNLEGTRALAEAAARAGVWRFVHFSSVAAMGPTADDEVDETTAPRPSGDAYAQTKLAIEETLRAVRGLPAVILRPTIVYGPRGTTWSTRLIEQVKARRVALPASGLGLCNAVYVDDLIAAALLACEHEAAVGETFLISGAQPVTWLDFYRAYESMARGKPVVPLSDQDFDAEARRRYGSSPLLAKIRRKLEARFTSAEKRAGLLYLPDPGSRALYASRTRARIDKAREKLGYAPDFDLARGMAETAVWARAAGLIE